MLQHRRQIVDVLKNDVVCRKSLVVDVLLILFQAES